jgi:hypothetical protein
MKSYDDENDERQFIDESKNRRRYEKLKQHML